MFFLAATLVGWIGGDFVYRKVAAKTAVHTVSSTYILLDDRPALMTQDCRVTRSRYCLRRRPDVSRWTCTRLTASSVHRTWLLPACGSCYYQLASLGKVNFQQTLQREAFWHAYNAVKSFIAGLCRWGSLPPMSPTVKEFWKSVNIWWSYGREFMTPNSTNITQFAFAKQQALWSPAPYINSYSRPA